MTKRYTAVIRIIEIDETTLTKGTGYNQTVEKVSKDTELAKLEIRAGSLETLKSDIQAHVGLVKDMNHGSDIALQNSH